MSLWAGEDLPFCLQFLHRGYLFREKMPIWSVDGSGMRELRFSPQQFDYSEGPSGSVPDELGYSGFAVCDRTSGRRTDRVPVSVLVVPTILLSLSLALAL